MNKDRLSFVHLINIMKGKKKKDKKKREDTKTIQHFASKQQNDSLTYPTVKYGPRASILHDTNKTHDQIYTEIYHENRWTTNKKIEMVEESIKLNPVKFAHIDYSIDNLLVH